MTCISGRHHSSSGRVGQTHRLLVFRGGVILLILLGCVPSSGGRVVRRRPRGTILFPQRRDQLSFTDLLRRHAALFAPLQKGFGSQSLCPRVKAGTVSKEMPSHATCETILRPGSPGTTRVPPGRTRLRFPRLGAVGGEGPRGPSRTLAEAHWVWL